jgi:hypothetical protein
MTLSYESTVGGAFNEQPDQVARLVKDDPNSILYFCEDGGKGDNSPGVSGRSPNGEYFDIFRGTFPIRMKLPAWPLVPIDITCTFHISMLELFTTYGVMMVFLSLGPCWISNTMLWM